MIQNFISYGRLQDKTGGDRAFAGNENRGGGNQSSLAGLPIKTRLIKLAGCYGHMASFGVLDALVVPDNVCITGFTVDGEEYIKVYWSLMFVSFSLLGMGMREIPEDSSLAHILGGWRDIANEFIRALYNSNEYSKFYGGDTALVFPSSFESSKLAMIISEEMADIQYPGWRDEIGAGEWGQIGNEEKAEIWYAVPDIDYNAIFKAILEMLNASGVSLTALYNLRS